MLPLLFFLSLASSRLVAVVEVCRHGARSPTKFQPWDNMTIWPQGPGELTPMGMRQHFLLGTELQRRYVNQSGLLMLNYFQPELWIFTSDTDRCIMSAQSQVQGLYPSGTGPLLRNATMETVAVPPISIGDLGNLIQTLEMDGLPNLTQVVPIHDDSPIRQFEMNPGDSCGYYMYLINYKQGLTSQIQQLFDQFPDVMNTIVSVMNISQATAQKNYRNIIDSLLCNQFQGYPLINGFNNQTFLNRASQLSTLLKNFYEFEPDLLARFAGTPVMNQILENFQSVISGNVTQKFFLYSGHDTTVSYMLAFLQLNFTSPPPFAATFIFELHQSGKQYYVRASYNDVLQVIPTCGGVNCSFDNFERYVDVRAIPDYVNMCQINATSTAWMKMNLANSSDFHLPGHDEDDSFKWYFWVGLGHFIAVFVVILISVVLKLLRHNKSYSLPTRTNEESLMTIKDE